MGLGTLHLIPPLKERVMLDAEYGLVLSISGSQRRNGHPRTMIRVEYQALQLGYLPLANMVHIFADPSYLVTGVVGIGGGTSSYNVNSTST